MKKEYKVNAKRSVLEIELEPVNEGGTDIDTVRIVKGSKIITVMILSEKYYIIKQENAFVKIF